MYFRSILTAATSGALVLGTLSIVAVPAVAEPSETTVAAAAASDTINRANQQQIVDVFNGINAYRAEQGVPPVTFNVSISEVAEDWSDEMSVSGFRHSKTYYTDPRVGEQWMFAGEIIAANHETDGESLVYQWINSEGHAELMRHSAVEVIGVGITRSASSEYGMYGTVNLFSFRDGGEPAGAYATAQDFFDGKTANDLVKVTPAAPTFRADSDEYVIPANQPGVEYYVDGVLKAPGSYPAEWRRVAVTAKATDGYALEGTTNWSFEAQLRRITAEAPIFDGAEGTFTIPSQEGVLYNVQIGGNYGPWGPGRYTGFGPVEITAFSNDQRYILEGTTHWEHTFPAPEQEPAPPAEDPAPPAEDPAPAPEAPNDPTPAPAPFSDAHQSGFQSAIGWMRDKGISKGYGDNTYRPFESVSREAMAAFVYRLAGEPKFIPPTESPFKDVDTTSGFYKEIAWMKETGLSKGWSDGTYRPYDTVSREAMAAFMKRFAGDFCHVPGAAEFTAPASPTFNDSQNSGFYKEIEWMRVAGVSTGWLDGTYRPYDNVSREAMAAFMQRLDTHINANSGCTP